MKQGLKLLVLAGSSEARFLAQEAQAAGAHVKALVSEAPRGRNPMPVPCELVSLEDSDAMDAAISGFDAILDASHGFDDRMSEVGADIAQKTGIPHLCYVRPPWSAEAIRGAQSVQDVGAALAMTGAGARVFSATGWASLPEFAEFAGARLFLRQTTKHDRPAPFDFLELAFGDPPFDVASETALFGELAIDTLICRNLGGAASRPKVEAAAALGIRTFLIDRPALPQGIETTNDLDAALDWVARL